MTEADKCSSCLYPLTCERFERCVATKEEASPVVVQWQAPPSDHMAAPAPWSLGIKWELPQTSDAATSWGGPLNLNQPNAE